MSETIVGVKPCIFKTTCLCQSINIFELWSIWSPSSFIATPLICVCPLTYWINIIPATCMSFHLLLWSCALYRNPGLLQLYCRILLTVKDACKCVAVKWWYVLSTHPVKVFSRKQHECLSSSSICASLADSRRHNWCDKQFVTLHNLYNLYIWEEKINTHYQLLSSYFIYSQEAYSTQMEERIQLPNPHPGCSIHSAGFQSPECYQFTTSLWNSLSQMY